MFVHVSDREKDKDVEGSYGVKVVIKVTNYPKERKMQSDDEHHPPWGEKDR